jgi:hypothetical protein
MKKYLLFLVAGTALFMSCGKTGGLGSISQDINSDATIYLPGVPGYDTVLPGGVNAYAPTLGVPTNTASTLQQSNISSDKVTSVYLTKMSVKIQEPAGQAFDIMDTIKVYISADGLEEKLMAHKYGVPAGQQSVDLDCESSVDMKDYFLKDKMNIRFGGHFVKEPDSTTQVRLDFTHKLTANVLK